MNKQTFVLLVVNQSLLGDILEELLAGNKNLLVHRTTPCLYKKMLREIKWPDSLVVVIELETLNDSPARITHEAGKGQRLQLIIVSSESDDVAVYTSNGTHHADRIKLTGLAGLAMLVNACAGQSPEQSHWPTAVTSSITRSPLLL